MNAKRFTFIVAATLAAWPALAQFQAGRPVTAADLSGKTVCWDNGWRITYARDGSVFGARGDARAINHHTSYWSVTEPGVVMEVRPEHEERYLQIVVLQDGRFERDRFGKHGVRRTWGTLCP